MNNSEICPVCNGTGSVSYPPGVAGHQNTFVDSSSGPWPCHVCGGSGVLSDNGYRDYKMSPYYLDQINKGLGQDIIRLQDEIEQYKKQLDLIKEWYHVNVYVGRKDQRGFGPRKHPDFMQLDEIIKDD